MNEWIHVNYFLRDVALTRIHSSTQSCCVHAWIYMTMCTNTRQNILYTSSVLYVLYTISPGRREREKRSRKKERICCNTSDGGRLHTQPHIPACTRHPIPLWLPSLFIKLMCFHNFMCSGGWTSTTNTPGLPPLTPSFFSSMCAHIRCKAFAKITSDLLFLCSNPRYYISSSIRFVICNDIHIHIHIHIVEKVATVGGGASDCFRSIRPHTLCNQLFGHSKWAHTHTHTHAHQHTWYARFCRRRSTWLSEPESLSVPRTAIKDFEKIISANDERYYGWRDRVLLRWKLELMLQEDKLLWNT